MLRDKLVEVALEWQSKFGVAPSITSAVSEYDAAMLVGMSESDYSEYMKDKDRDEKDSKDLSSSSADTSPLPAKREEQVF